MKNIHKTHNNWAWNCDNLHSINWPNTNLIISIILLRRSFVNQKIRAKISHTSNVLSYAGSCHFNKLMPVLAYNVINIFVENIRANGLIYLIDFICLDNCSWCYAKCLTIYLIIFVFGFMTIISANSHCISRKKCQINLRSRFLSWWTV